MKAATAILLLTGLCSCAQRDEPKVEEQAAAMLAGRLNNPARVISIAAAANVSCGYAEVKGANSYADIVPFMIEGDELVLFEDRPQGFERCPSGFVQPNAVQGVP